MRRCTHSKRGRCCGWTLTTSLSPTRPSPSSSASIRPLVLKFLFRSGLTSRAGALFWPDVCVVHTAVPLMWDVMGCVVMLSCHNSPAQASAPRSVAANCRAVLLAHRVQCKQTF